MADEDKQFEASPQKLKKAREEGQVFKSKDLTSAVFLVVMFSLLIAMSPFVFNEVAALFIVIFELIPEKGIEEVGWQYLALLTLKSLVMMIGPFLLIGVLIAIGTEFFQVGPIVATKAIEPKFNKLNPVKGFQNIFSQNTVIELVKNLLKISILGYVGYRVFMDFLPRMLTVGDAETVFALLALIGDILMKFILMAGLAFIIMSGADFLYQRWKYMKDQKMSFKEMKDEYKNSEGDPMVKHALKQRRMQMLQKRMLDAVPQADAVITNPIHIAVAVQYNPQEHDAPIVIAKGMELFAEQIKAIAREHGIPIIENPEVARTLYKLVDLDQEVPADIYQTVAEILLFAWRMVGKPLPTGAPTTEAQPPEE